MNPRSRSHISRQRTAQRAIRERQPAGSTKKANNKPIPAGSPLTPTVLRQIQQQHGNQYVQRLLAQRKTGDNTAPGDDTAPNASSAPLIGLKKGDGLDWGTWDKRPRVKLLQHKLNEKVMAGLDVDGMFGDKTADALQAFQLSISVPPAGVVDPVTADALMGKKEPTPPNIEPPVTPPNVTPPNIEPPVTPPNVEPPNVNPPANNNQYNPALEDKLDAIWNAKQFILFARRDGLSMLGRSLKQTDNSGHKDGFKQTVKDGANEGLKKGTEALRGLIVDEISGDTAKSVVSMVLDKGFNFGLAGVVSSAVDFVVDLFAPDPASPPPGSAVDVFIEGRIKAITDASFNAQQKFITEGKQKFRDKEAQQSGQGMKEADELLQVLHKKRDVAPKIQYEESLQKWSVLMAQQHLGQAFDKIDPNIKLGTNMGNVDDVKKAPGVLKVPVQALDPDSVLNKPHNKAIKIAGLSPTVRAKLQGRKINDVGFPIMAEGRLKGRFLPDKDHAEGKPFDVEVNFRINEKDTVWGWDAPDDAKRWLREKYAIKELNLPPGAPIPTHNQASVEGLLIALRQELGAHTDADKVEEG